MQFSLRSLALVAVVFASQLTLSAAGPVQAHKHHLRQHRRTLVPAPEARYEALSDRQAPAAYPQVQDEVNKFTAFMTNWFASPNAGSAASIAQVQQEVQNHQAAMAAAINSVTGSQATQVLQSELQSFGAWVSAWAAQASAMTSADAVAQLKQDVTSYEGFLTSWLGSPVAAAPSTGTSPETTMTTVVTHSQTTTLISVITATGTPPPATTPVPASSSIPAPAHSMSTAVPFSITPVSAAPSVTPTPSPGGGSQNGGSGSAFNPNAQDNIAVYFGQTPDTVAVPLDQVCSAPGNNIIILAFLTEFFGPGGYPTINFGGSIGGNPLPGAAAKGATGLLDATELASKVAQCQKAGKIVLLSIGGAASSSVFTSDAQATTFANTIWNLFGGGTEDSDLRPFGNIKLDGFDIDSESHNPTGFTALTTSLRKLFDEDKSKTYYISAAPQCPRPDASIPLDAMKAMDFVWVQFYNNGNCNIGASDFVSSFQSWSQDLSTGKGANGAPTKLYVGVPAAPAAAAAYLQPAALASALGSIKGKANNFGGVMMWDGSEAVKNGNYQQVAKQALA